MIWCYLFHSQIIFFKNHYTKKLVKRCPTVSVHQFRQVLVYRSISRHQRSSKRHGEGHRWPKIVVNVWRHWRNLPLAYGSWQTHRPWEKNARNLLRSLVVASQFVSSSSMWFWLFWAPTSLLFVGAFLSKSSCMSCNSQIKTLLRLVLVVCLLLHQNAHGRNHMIRA